jgi:hypothetical protein
MNVQKIFDVLHGDQDNTALGLIRGELEEQGYKVQIDGREVTSAEIFDGDHKDLEDTLKNLNSYIARIGNHL